LDLACVDNGSDTVHQSLVRASPPAKMFATLAASRGLLAVLSPDCSAPIQSAHSG
jgi:hypothetical protein